MFLRVYVLLVFCFSVISMKGRRIRISPNSYVIEVGTSLVLTCNITNVSGEYVFNGDNFWFKVAKNVFYPSHPWVFRVNSYSAQLRINNATVKDSGWYRCYYNSSEGVESAYAKMGITVAYPPDKVNVSSVSCVVDNWSTMNCSYDIGRLTNIKTNYTVEYCVRGICDHCPVQKKNYCVWAKSYINHCRTDGKENFFMDDKVYRIFVNSSNVLVEHPIQSDMKIVDARHVVKPAKVENIRIKILNSTSINVTWHVQTNEKPQIFAIYYKSDFDIHVKKQRTHLDISPETLPLWINNSQREQYIVLTDLMPFTVYEINITAIPYVAVDGTMQELGFWSDNATAHQRLPSDVPKCSPVLTAGSYQKKCAESRCTIKILWPSIPLQYRHGIINGYKITIKSLDTDYHKTYEPSGASRSYLFRDLTQGERFMVTLSARTEEGYADNNATLLIPRNADAPPPRLVSAVKVLPSVVNVSWEYDGRPSEFNVLWCRGKDDVCSDMSELHNQTVPGRLSSTLVHVDSLDQHIFAVSATYVATATVGSSMAFSKCLYSGNVSNPPVIELAKIQADYTVSTDLRVNCEDVDSVVLAFQISYCLASHDVTMCSGPVKSKNTTDPANNHLDLSGLIADAAYLVWGQTITRSGTSQQGGRKIVHTTGLNSGEIVGIVLGALLGLAMALGGLVACWRKSGSAIRNYLKPMSFQIPGNEENTANGNGSGKEIKEETGARSRRRQDDYDHVIDLNDRNSLLLVTDSGRGTSAEPSDSSDPQSVNIELDHNKSSDGPLMAAGQPIQKSSDHQSRAFVDLAELSPNVGDKVSLVVDLPVEQSPDIRHKVPLVVDCPNDNQGKPSGKSIDLRAGGANPPECGETDSESDKHYGEGTYDDSLASYLLGNHLTESAMRLATPPTSSNLGSDSSAINQGRHVNSDGGDIVIGNETYEGSGDDSSSEYLHRRNVRVGREARSNEGRTSSFHGDQEETTNNDNSSSDYRVRFKPRY